MKKIIQKNFSMSAEEFLSSAEYEGIDTTLYGYGTNFEDMTKEESYDFFLNIIVPYITKTEDSSEDAVYRIKDILEYLIK